MNHCGLPLPIDKNQYKNLSLFFNAIFDEFRNSILNISFHERYIQLQNPANNKTIWHILTKNGNQNNQRFINYSRASKVTWIKYLLNENNSCPHCDKYLFWKKKHNNRIRWLILCSEEKYIIILEEHGIDIFYLITAFEVTPHRYNDFLKEYTRYINFGI